MFWTVRLSIIRSLFTVHSAMVYVIQVCSQLSSRTRKAVYKLVWHIPLLSVQWINSWWWADELSKTWRVSWRNKFVKLVHLVGFITKKRCLLSPSHSSDWPQSLQDTSLINTLSSPDHFSIYLHILWISWRWKWYIPLNHWCHSLLLHNGGTQKTINLMEGIPVCL